MRTGVLRLSLSLFVVTVGTAFGSVTDDVRFTEPFWYSARLVIPQVHIVISPYEQGLLISETIDLPNLDLANGVKTLDLTFEGAEDLEASVTSEACDLQIEGNRVLVRLPANQTAGLNVKYWRDWSEESEPVVISLGEKVPIVFAVISLRKANLHLEAVGLKKELFDSFELYTGRDLNVNSQAEIKIYPPKPWRGDAVVGFVLLGSVGLIFVFLMLKFFITIKQFSHDKNGMRNDE